MPDDNKLLAKGMLLCREGHELLVPVLDPFSLGKGSHTVYYRPFPSCDFIDLANEANYFRAVKGLENYAEMIRLLTGTKGAIKVYCEVATIEGAQTAVAFSRGCALTYMEQLSDRLIRFVGGSTGVWRVLNIHSVTGDVCLKSKGSPYIEETKAYPLNPNGHCRVLSAT